MLTACGIETDKFSLLTTIISVLLQQCLPLAVLKHLNTLLVVAQLGVATVLTACGIETL